MLTDAQTLRDYSERIEDVMKYIREHINEPLNREMLAAVAGFSIPHFHRVFTAQVGESAASYIRRLRLERADAIIVGAGTLTVNANGKLNGLIRVGIAGLENIVPKLGIDRLIGRGLDKLNGGSGQAQQGLNALDRLLPGLGGVVRDSATASVIDSLNKMGQPTEIDKKPAIVLPLNFSDGFVSLGMVPLGEVPALF